MSWRRYFDRDWSWLARPTFQHYAGCALVCALFLLFEPPARALFDTMLVAIAFEVGQLDVAITKALLGEPGYGIGLMDLIAGFLGALTSIGAYYLGAWLVWLI